MRNTLLSFLALFGTATTQGQDMMVMYDISPNWTATDINGNSHTLYDYLDDGYTVIIDFSTTWCPPCIALHQAHTLNNLYNLYGPGTPTDRLMVFLVEVDPATDLADLQGTGGGGYLDWTAGTDYPIIDDAAVGDLYGVFGYPTVYTICPSRMISAHSYSASTSFMWAQAQTCNHYIVDSPNDATLIGMEPQVLCHGGDEAFHTIIRNEGTEPLTSATVEVVNIADSTVVSSVEWTGSLATYEMADVYPPAWNAPPGMQGVYYRLATSDDDGANDSTVVEHFYAQSPPSNGTEVIIEILTDDHAESLNWRLSNAFGAEVDRRDAGSYEDNTLYTHTYTLPTGVCWNFVLYNESIDHFEEPGYFRLRSAGGTFITVDECAEYITPGAFFYDQAYFATHETSTGIADVSEPAIAISPNPAQDRIMITGAGADATIQLRDAAGRLLRNERSTRADHVMDIGGLNNGVYLVGIRQGDRTTTRTLLVAH
ncbi:MAG TPA: T9SS type A sorting domain-containing protein [Flavobacteriales bacterium]